MAFKIDKPFFNPSFGNKPARIVGRQEDIDRIARGLSSPRGSRDRATLVKGLRGYGKTALLLEVADAAEAQGVVCADVTAGSTMLDEILEIVEHKAAQGTSKRARLTGVSAGALGFSLGVDVERPSSRALGFRSQLTAQLEQLDTQGTGLLVLIDEVQPDSDEMREFAHTYQHLVGHGFDVSVVMAGLPQNVSNVINDKVLTFLNRAKKVDLGAISIGEVAAYFASSFRSMDIAIENDVLKQLAASTQGVPYLLQLVGYYVCQIGVDGKPMGQDGASLAMTYARQDYANDVLEPSLRPLSTRDLDILCAMAANCTNGVAEVADILAVLGITNSYFQTYRRRLLDTGLITSHAKGKLEFALPYLGDYLRELNE